MIARAILPLLLLNVFIIHVHIELHRCHIFMSQQFLEAEGIFAEFEVANGKCVAEDVWTDTLARDPCSLLETPKE